MTFTQLFLLPSALNLVEQLDLLKTIVSNELRPVFGSADFSVVNGDLSENSTAPLQIEQVRQLQLSVLHAPLLHAKRLIFIANIELASIPAQNALLKLLEEPPAHVQFLVTTNQLSAVLETIQSRSQVTQLTRDNSRVEESTLSDSLQQLFQTHPAQQLSVSEVFKLSEEYKDRAQALLLMQSVVNFLHPKLNLRPSPKLLQFVKTAVTATQQLEKNVNPRLVVEEFFFQFVAPKS